MQFTEEYELRKKSDNFLSVFLTWEWNLIQNYKQVRKEEEDRQQCWRCWVLVYSVKQREPLSTLWSDAVSKLLVSILKVLIIASKCLTADLDTLLLAKGHTLSKCPYFVTESPFCPKI